MSREIFKVQKPLAGHDPGWLVYNQDRSKFGFINPTDELEACFGSDGEEAVKTFVRADWEKDFISGGNPEKVDWENW